MSACSPSREAPNAAEPGVLSRQARYARLERYLRDQDAACLSCGYCLRGLRAERCPECGELLDSDDLVLAATSRTAWWRGTRGLSVLLLVFITLAIIRSHIGWGVLPDALSALVGWRSSPGLLHLAIVAAAIAWIFWRIWRGRSSPLLLALIALGNLALVFGIILVVLLA